MKVLTEEEVALLTQIDSLAESFVKLPYHIPNERTEFSKRIQELKQIVAIRAMLRSGDGKGLPEQQKQIG